MNNNRQEEQDPHPSHERGTTSNGEPMSATDVRALLPATTPQAAAGFKDKLETRLVRELELRAQGPQELAQDHASLQASPSPHPESAQPLLGPFAQDLDAAVNSRTSGPASRGLGRMNWPAGRAFARTANRLSSAVVMLTLFTVLVAGLVVFATNRPSKTANTHPPGNPQANGTTPTPPGVPLDNSPKTSIALQPLVTITTTVFFNESIAWSPDGTLLASASPSGTLDLWRSSTGQKIRSINKLVDGISWSAQGAAGGQSARSNGLIASRHYSKGIIELWDPSTGKDVQDVQLARSTESHSIAWSPDGRFLASTDGWELEIWDSTAQALVPKPQPTWPAPIAPSNVNPNGITNLAWSPDGKQLATSQDRFIQVWDPLGGQELATLDNKGRVLSIAWNPHTPVIAAIITDQPGGNALALWDTHTSMQIRPPMPVGYGVSLAWSPQGDILAFGRSDAADTQGYANSYVTLYDNNSGTVLLTLDGLATELAWSPDGLHLAKADYAAALITIWGVIRLESVARTPVAGGAHPTATPIGSACTAAWKLVTLPVGLDKADSVQVLAAISAGDAWALSSAHDTLGFYQSTILHWNGSVWATSPSLSPRTGDSLQLSGLAAVSRDDVWAVGSYWYRSDGDRPLIEHWNGQAWSPAVGPTLERGSLWSISAASANDIWVVGSHIAVANQEQPAMMHWDGRKWAMHDIPTVGSSMSVQNVVAISANDAWAVGSYYGDVVGNSPGMPLIIHWDGSRVSVASLPSLGDAALYGVAATSANDVWAVGYKSLPNSNTMLALHWDGVQWVEVRVPQVSIYDSLNGIAAIAKDDAWAVGSQVLHWDGKAWNLIVSPNTLDPAWQRTYGVLIKVAATRDGTIWMAGQGTDRQLFMARLDSATPPCIDPAGFQEGLPPPGPAATGTIAPGTLPPTETPPPGTPDPSRKIGSPPPVPTTGRGGP